MWGELICLFCWLFQFINMNASIYLGLWFLLSAFSNFQDSDNVHVSLNLHLATSSGLIANCVLLLILALYIYCFMELIFVYSSSFLLHYWIYLFVLDFFGGRFPISDNMIVTWERDSFISSFPIGLPFFLFLASLQWLQLSFLCLTAFVRIRIFTLFPNFEEKHSVFHHPE